MSGLCAPLPTPESCPFQLNLPQSLDPMRGPRPPCCTPGTPVSVPEHPMNHPGSGPRPRTAPSEPLSLYPAPLGCTPWTPVSAPRPSCNTPLCPPGSAPEQPRQRIPGRPGDAGCKLITLGASCVHRPGSGQSSARACCTRDASRVTSSQACCTPGASHMVPQHTSMGMDWLFANASAVIHWADVTNSTIGFTVNFDAAVAFNFVLCWATDLLGSASYADLRWKDHPVCNRPEACGLASTCVSSVQFRAHTRRVVLLFLHVVSQWLLQRKRRGTQGTCATSQPDSSSGSCLPRTAPGNRTSR